MSGCSLNNFLIKSRLQISLKNKNMKYVAALALLFISVFSYGQSKKFVFKLGEEYELPKKSEDLAYYGDSANGIINLSYYKKQLTVYKFDFRSLSQKGGQEVELNNASKNFNSEEVITIGGNCFWLHSDWDKGNKKEKLYSSQIDIKTGRAMNENKLLFENDKVAGDLQGGGWFASGAKTVNKYDYNYNAGNNKLLISYRYNPEIKNDKKNYDKLGFFVVDEKMNKIWSNDFTMPYTEAVMDNSDFSIDENGNAYLLAKVYNSDARKETDKETGKPGYHYEVFKFTADGSMIHKAIESDDYYLKQPTLIENGLHEMIIATTYSKKSTKKSNGTDGVFLAKFDGKNDIVQYKKGVYEFALDELKKYESKRAKRKMDKKSDYEAPNLRIRDVIVNSDGSTIITLEDYHVEVSASTYSGATGTRTTTQYTYYYDDILVTKIAADGNVVWLRKIPKRQKSTTTGLYDAYSRNAVFNPVTGTLGFKTFVDATGCYFLYLDNLKNMELEDDDVPKYHVNGFGGQVVVTKIDDAGNMTKDLVFDTREEKIMLFPRQFKQINKNQFIGRAKLKSSYQPLLIKVN